MTTAAAAAAGAGSGFQTHKLHDRPPSTPPPRWEAYPQILVRDNALVVSVDHVKLILSADKVRARLEWGAVGVLGRMAEERATALLLQGF